MILLCAVTCLAGMTHLSMGVLWVYGLAWGTNRVTPGEKMLIFGFGQSGQHQGHAIVNVSR